MSVGEMDIYQKVRFSLGAHCALRRLDVGDGDAVAAGRCRGQDLAVLLDVNDGSASGADCATGCGRRCASELDGAEVGEGHKRVTLLEVLDNPLRVLLAEPRARRERLADGLAAGDVLDDGGAGRGGRGGDGELNLITSADGDAREVGSEVGEVLVPSYRRTRT